MWGDLRRDIQKRVLEKFQTDQPKREPKVKQTPTPLETKEKRNSGTPGLHAHFQNSFLNSSPASGTYVQKRKKGRNEKKRKRGQREQVQHKGGSP